MRPTTRRNIFIIMAVLVILLAVTAVYFYRKSTQSGDISPTETKALMRKVGNLVVLPEDETPTIATVSDPAALKDQAFFIGAKKGDKVLIYSTAKKAILYDPVINKVVNIAPLSVDTSTSPTSGKSF